MVGHGVVVGRLGKSSSGSARCVVVKVKIWSPSRCVLRCSVVNLHICML